MNTPTPPADWAREAAVALAELEAANDECCALRSPAAYQALTQCPGMSDALLRLDRARDQARRIIANHAPAAPRSDWHVRLAQAINEAWSRETSGGSAVGVAEMLSIISQHASAAPQGWVQKIQDRIDYHDHHGSMAEAADMPESAAYHDAMRKELASMLSAAPTPPQGGGSGEREAFEAWYRATFAVGGSELKHEVGGSYVMRATQSMWLAWQSRTPAAAAVGLTSEERATVEQLEAAMKDSTTKWTHQVALYKDHLAAVVAIIRRLTGGRA